MHLGLLASKSRIAEGIAQAAAMQGPPIPGESIIHSFIPQKSVEPLRCSRHYSKHGIEKTENRSIPTPCRYHSSAAHPSIRGGQRESSAPTASVTPVLVDTFMAVKRAIGTHLLHEYRYL